MGANGPEGVAAAQATEGPGDHLLHLGHALHLFTETDPHGDLRIGHVAPDIVGVEAQTVHKLEPLALPGPAPLARRRPRAGLATSPAGSVRRTAMTS